MTKKDRNLVLRDVTNNRQNAIMISSARDRSVTLWG